MPRITILYVEDDRLVLNAVRDTLESEGWRVDACEDGTAALEKIRSAEPYHLLLVDNELPGVGGLELVRRLRSLEHRRHIPVVVLSAGECGAVARRAGADEFLLKPEGISMLTETVSRLLAAPSGRHHSSPA